MDNTLIISYIVYIGISIVFSLLINSLFLKFSTNLGTRSNTDGMIRWNKQVKPAIGGIGFFILFLFSVVFYIVFQGGGDALGNKEFLGLIGVCTLGFLMGLADDAYNTKPLLKFAVQVVCAAILIASGNYIMITTVAWIDYALTLFWIVGMMNSINMLDNMDGITASISLNICLGLITLIALQKQWDSIYFALIIGVAASLMGFLYYNWYPSKMFMGDTGSQFLGVFLAAVSIKFLWNAPDILGDTNSSKQLLMVALFFVVPLSDTTTVSVNRILQGKSPFVGGRDHTTHHLVYMGLKERHVAVLLNIFTLFAMFVALYFVYYNTGWNIGYFMACTISFAAIFAFLYSTTRRKQFSNGKK